MDCTALRTQQEVADELGLSRARVMQLEQSALKKLRIALEALEAQDAFLYDRQAPLLPQGGSR